MTAREFDVVVTTPLFRAGQNAARQVAGMGGAPLWDLVNGQDPEFARGFRYEWTEYIETDPRYRAIREEI